MVSDTAVHAARETRKFGRLPLTDLIQPRISDDMYPGFSADRFSKLKFESAVEYILEVLGVSDRENLISDEMYPLVIRATSDLTAEIHFTGVEAHYDKFPADWIIAEAGSRVSPSRLIHSERMPVGLQVQRSVGGEALARVAASIVSQAR